MCYPGDHRSRSSRRRWLKCQGSSYSDPGITGHLSTVNPDPVIPARQERRLHPGIRTPDDHGRQLCLRSKYAGDRRRLWDLDDSGRADRRWCRSIYHGYSGQEDQSFLPAADHRYRCIYHWSVPVPDSDQLHGGRHKQSGLRFLAELASSCTEPFRQGNPEAGFHSDRYHRRLYRIHPIWNGKSFKCRSGEDVPAPAVHAFWHPL